MFLCFACIGTPSHLLVFCVLYAGPPRRLGNVYKPCPLQVPRDIYKPFSLLSASWVMGLSGLAVAPAPAPCAMHVAWRPRSRSRWVLGLRLLLLLLCPVFCLLNSLPPACVFVFCLLRHSLPPARVLCLVRFPGPPHGKKMRPSGRQGPLQGRPA